MPLTLKEEIETDKVFGLNVHLIRYYLDWNYNLGYFYHYTSKYFARLILNDLILKAGEARIPHFGIGVFMTKLGPKETTDCLLQNNYRGNSKYKERLECAFAIKSNQFVRFVPISDKMFPSRDLWKSRNDIDLTKCTFFLIIRE